jgi:hypothetical protein
MAFELVDKFFRVPKVAGSSLRSEDASLGVHTWKRKNFAI